MKKNKRTLPRQGEVSIYRNQGGGVTIEQKGEYGIEEDSIIQFRKRDVPLICKWLQECAEEISGEL